MSLILARWYAIPCGLCVPRARSGCPSGFSPVSFVCVCAHALVASAPPPPPRVGVARAPHAVPVLGAGRAVPRGPCPSACPASVPSSVWLAWGGGGGRPGPVSPYVAWGCALPAGWVRAWGPVTNPTARALVCWLCALWGRHEGAQGGRLLPGCRASRVGGSPTPNHSSSWGCGRGPLPTGCGCGGCGRGDPSPIPARALLRAAEGARGGRLLPGRPGLGALPPPTARPLGRAAGGHYPLAVGAGGAGVVTRRQPHSARSCVLAWRAVGAARGRPGGGASCLGVGRPGSGDLQPPTTRPFGRAAGAHYPLAVGAGGAGVGTRHQPHSARSCELALRAVGAARGCPGGAPLAWVWSVRGRALPHPRPLVLSGVQPWPTTHWLWVRGVRAWGPVTNPTARTLAS